MTVKHHDITTIKGIKTKLEYKVEKSIKDFLKKHFSICFLKKYITLNQWQVTPFNSIFFGLIFF